MVIGNGLLAKAFATFSSDNSVVIFASGVSDSTCSDEREYERETKLLEETIQRYSGAILVYFSTTGVKDPDLQNTRYVLHKKSMEEKILLGCKAYSILRVSNVVGVGGNKKNILNFLIEKIKNQEPFEVWLGSARNFVGINEVFLLVKSLIADGRFLNQTVDIVAPESIRIIDLVDYLGNLLGTKPQYSVINRGGQPAYDHEICNTLRRDYNINMDSKYQYELIRKHVLELK